MNRCNVTAKMLTKFETKLAELFKEKAIRVPIHLCGSVDGEYEKWLVGLFKLIDDDDYVFSTHRNHFHYLLKTGDFDGLLSELCGETTGVCSGKSGSMHTINHNRRFYSSGIVAGCAGIAVGVAKALKDSKSTSKVYCFLGDGAEDSGYFFEAWRYAVGFELPITYIIEDNDRSVCTNRETRWGDSRYVMPKTINELNRLVRVKYEAKYPHVGCGKWVTF